MTRIERFADQYRLKVTRDECHDQVIQGRRGQLYFDGDQLCLMVLDGTPSKRSRWAELGGKLWMGDLSRNARGRRVQDVKITGIPLENARAAIGMVRCKAKRIVSPAQQAVIDRMLTARGLPPAHLQKHPLAVESPREVGVGVRGGKLSPKHSAPGDDAFYTEPTNITA